MKSVPQKYKEVKLMKCVSITNRQICKASSLQSLCNRNFRKLLLEAVDEGLSSLGDSSKHAIYYYLEKAFNIPKQDVPDKIEEFVKAIEEIFGDGAKILEIRIMKNLYEKVGDDFEYFPERNGLLFTKYVKAVNMHIYKKMSSDLHLGKLR
jgi:hypothetical protein